MSLRNKRVAVLGCGPSGLFAAHALTQKGLTVDIFSRKRKSEMFGAQYLHQMIPGLSTSDSWISISYELRGDSEGYARKVYGMRDVDFISPDRFGGQSVVWDIRQAYGAAWDAYSTNIEHIDTITPAWMKAMLNGAYRKIYSSLPAPNLCDEPSHQFSAQRVWSIGDAPERGVFSPVQVPRNTVVCEGTPDVGWYRASNLFGYATVEWPQGRKPPIPGIAEVMKPISTNCTCHLDGRTKVVRIGRYGRWDKSELSHMAYQEIMEGTR